MPTEQELKGRLTDFIHDIFIDGGVIHRVLKAESIELTQRKALLWHALNTPFDPFATHLDQLEQEYGVNAATLIVDLVYINAWCFGYPYRVTTGSGEAATHHPKHILENSGYLSNPEVVRGCLLACVQDEVPLGPPQTPVETPNPPQQGKWRQRCVPRRDPRSAVMMEGVTRYLSALPGQRTNYYGSGEPKSPDTPVSDPGPRGSWSHRFPP